MVTELVQGKRAASSSASRFWCCGAPQSHSPTSGAEMSQSEKWSLFSKPHLKESIQKSSSDKKLTADMQKLVWAQQRPENAGSDGASEGEQSDEMMKAVDSIQAKEEEIEKRKVEVQQKVQAKLSKVELEARNLDNLRKELENLEDPTRKEVTEIRKKIETVDRELKPLKQLCDKKEKELKDATKAHEDKVKLKNGLVSKLKEIVAESESLRMKKLNELSKSFEELDQGPLTTPVA